MLAYRDSSYDRPNPTQAAAAYADGVRVWGGYLAGVVPPGPRSEGGSNLATAWSRTDFQVLQAAGIACVAFCSGWDDAAACGARARAWGVRLMLDVEDGIRGDGPWVDGWLQESGAGLYGLCSAHGHAAPEHIVARYPGGAPVAAWDPTCPEPTGLLGWQSQGTHTDSATGLSVDAGWVDDGFGGGLVVLGQDDVKAVADEVWAEAPPWLGQYLTQVAQEVVNGVQVQSPQGMQGRFAQVLADLGAGNGTVPAQLVQDVADLKSAVARIEAALKGLGSA